MVSDAAENRAKSARVRAILDRARTRRATWSAQIGRIGQNLSGRYFASSTDPRLIFAWGKDARGYGCASSANNVGLSARRGTMAAWRENPGLICLVSLLIFVMIA